MDEWWNITHVKQEQKWSSRTCLTIKVPSLEGVMAVSLSASSWTIMVFTDSVSPLLTFEELKEEKNKQMNNAHNSTTSMFKAY